MDSALDAVKKLVADEEKRLGIVRVPAPRDYVHCDWCGSNGCAACSNAREQRRNNLDAEYIRQFPDGPKPIFTANTDDPEQMEALKRVFHREKIEQAFGPGGRGMEQILEDSAREMAKRGETT